MTSECIIMCDVTVFIIIYRLSNTFRRSKFFWQKKITEKGLRKHSNMRTDSTVLSALILCNYTKSEIRIRIQRALRLRERDRNRWKCEILSEINYFFIFTSCRLVLLLHTSSKLKIYIIISTVIINYIIGKVYNSYENMDTIQQS